MSAVRGMEGFEEHRESKTSPESDFSLETIYSTCSLTRRDSGTCPDSHLYIISDQHF